MAGLFWITPEVVYLGAPPSTTLAAVLLRAEEVQAVGPAEGQWPWQDIESVAVSEAPVKSTTGRRLAKAFEVVWAPQSPYEMTVTIETTDGTRTEVLVHSAAATAYTAREVELSHHLLSLFVEGRLTPRVLIDWLLNTQISRNPGPDAREALLQSWTEIP